LFAEVNHQPENQLLVSMSKDRNKSSTLTELEGKTGQLMSLIQNTCGRVITPRGIDIEYPACFNN
jgi:hypothetical protein